jgi:hypothetical protein
VSAAKKSEKPIVKALKSAAQIEVMLRHQVLARRRYPPGLALTVKRVGDRWESLQTVRSIGSIWISSPA